jgi:hypothetical protein
MYWTSPSTIFLPAGLEADISATGWGEINAKLNKCKNAINMHGKIPELHNFWLSKKEASSKKTRS